MVKKKKSQKLTNLHCTYTCRKKICHPWKLTVIRNTAAPVQIFLTLEICVPVPMSHLPTLQLVATRLNGIAKSTVLDTSKECHVIIKNKKIKVKSKTLNCNKSCCDSETLV